MQSILILAASFRFPVVGRRSLAQVRKLRMKLVMNDMSVRHPTRVEVPLPPRLPVQLVRLGLLVEASSPVAPVGRPPAEDGQEAVHDAREEARLLRAVPGRRRRRRRLLLACNQRNERSGTQTKCVGRDKYWHPPHPLPPLVAFPTAAGSDKSLSLPAPLSSSSSPLQPAAHLILQIVPS